MKKNSFKKSQSIFEYICVTIVFAGVGISGFLLANQAASARLRGEVPTYKTTNTEMGETLNDGVSKEQYKWPETWNQLQAGSGGRVSGEAVDNPDVKSLPVPKEEE